MAALASSWALTEWDLILEFLLQKLHLQPLELHSLLMLTEHLAGINQKMYMELSPFHDFCKNIERATTGLLAGLYQERP